MRGGVVEDEIPTTGNAGGEREDDAAGKGGSNGGVDGVAALAEDLEPGEGGGWLLGGDETALASDLVDDDLPMGNEQ
jgi:hypothetical protein